MPNFPPNINWLGPVNWLHPLNRGLVSWWLVVPGVTGSPTWIDLARPSNGNHGTLTNMDLAVVWSADNSPGGWGSIDFDGTNDYADVGNDVSLDVAEFTIAAWFKADAMPAAQNDSVWFVGKDVSGGRSFDFGIRNETSPIALSVQINGADPGIATTNLTVDGLWHQGIVAYDGVEVFYYLDERADGSRSHTTDPAITTTAVRLGAREFVDFEEEFNGHLNDIRIYNRGLIMDEARLLYDLSRQGWPGLLNRLDRRLFVAAAGGGGGGANKRLLMGVG